MITRPCGLRRAGNYYYLLRQKAAQPSQMEHTINKTVKRRKRKKLVGYGKKLW